MHVRAMPVATEVVLGRFAVLLRAPAIAPQKFWLELSRGPRAWPAASDLPKAALSQARGARCYGFAPAAEPARPAGDAAGGGISEAAPCAARRARLEAGLPAQAASPGEPPAQAACEAGLPAPAAGPARGGPRCGGARHTDCSRRLGAILRHCSPPARPAFRRCRQERRCRRPS